MENEIVINGKTYVLKNQMASNEDKPIVMIRTYSAGVHYGILEKKESTLAGIEVTITNCRRVWQWSGAASISQLAVDGTSKPDKCKFPCSVPGNTLIAIEIIPMSEKAVESLNNVKVWQE